MEPLTRGDPESPLRWTGKSTRALAAERTAPNHPVSHEKVAPLLRQMEYRRQRNRKTEEGQDHADREAQFQHIHQVVQRPLAQGNPGISVDTKKKDLSGNYATQGRPWRQTPSPESVTIPDFPEPSVPRAYPYGIYDLGRNRGFVNVGTDHDPGAFAVASIRGWWRSEGRWLSPEATSLLITADAGGSKGYRLRWWQRERQKLAEETGWALHVGHFPPGTSKWNKVEHRLFSFSSSTGRGEPLQDYETVVRLIAATTTAKGLKVPCRLDRRKYAVGRKVTDKEYNQIHLQPDTFPGEWNYTILPNNTPTQM